jgi:hypothetical protein
MEAQYYINLFKGLLRKLEANSFQGPVACSIALVFLQEMNKDRRVEEMKADREKEKEKRKEPATSKQLDYLNILRVKANSEMTKEEAGKLIERALLKKSSWKKPENEFIEVRRVRD